MDLDDSLNVWGGGQLLAFSALDGPTDYGWTCTLYADMLLADR
jgi:hypothetical protein